MCNKCVLFSTIWKDLISSLPSAHITKCSCCKLVLHIWYWYKLLVLQFFPVSTVPFVLILQMICHDRNRYRWYDQLLTSLNKWFFVFENFKKYRGGSFKYWKRAPIMAEKEKRIYTLIFHIISIMLLENTYCKKH